MHKHHSRAGLVRGRVVTASRPVEICPGLRKVNGLEAIALIKVKRDSGRLWKQFVHYCRKYGLRWCIAGDKGNARARAVLGWYEVWGDANWLARLCTSGCVREWTDCLNVGAPRFYSK